MTEVQDYVFDMIWKVLIYQVLYRASNGLLAPMVTEITLVHSSSELLSPGLRMNR